MRFTLICRDCGKRIEFYYPLNAKTLKKVKIYNFYCVCGGYLDWEFKSHDKRHDIVRSLYDKNRKRIKVEFKNGKKSVLYADEKN